jgi:hypothetical protein
MTVSLRAFAGPDLFQRELVELVRTAVKQRGDDRMQNCTLACQSAASLCRQRTAIRKRAQQGSQPMTRSA